jgi:hypothetical protein
MFVLITKQTRTNLLFLQANRTFDFGIQSLYQYTVSFTHSIHRKTMYGIRDPRSRLDQNPAERGQPLEATGWETKRRRIFFQVKLQQQPSRQRGVPSQFR